MEISVRQRGGVFGLDRQVEVKDGVLTVSERGVRRALNLPPHSAERLNHLAASVLSTSAALRSDPAGPASDEMITEVDISHAGSRRSLALRSGDDAPLEVWDLIGAVGEASEA